MKERGKSGWKADGMFGPTAEYFLQVNGEFYNFVWQDASVVVTKDSDGQVVEWHATASKANLYVGQPASPSDYENASQLDLALEITVRRIP